MNRYSAENYKMLTRVSEFATKNVGLFPKSSAAVDIQAELATAVRELGELSSARISAETVKRSGRKEREGARDELKGLLSQASRTARALNREACQTAFKPTDHSLVAAGRAFAADIEPIKEEFLVYGISPEGLMTAVSEMERTIRDHTAAKAKRAAAIREFDEKLVAAMESMRRFEALVENFLAKNPPVMAEWSVARTLDRVVTRKRSVKSEPANPAVPPIAA